jgi:SAM-dependent methyltransferase
VAFERLEPDTPEWTAYLANHEQRYKFAIDQLRHLTGASRVLDAATGVGYGAARLTDASGARVVGVDCDARALEIAQRHYARATVDYVLDDCQTLSNLQMEHGYDAVVSFETIEHLREPDRFLRRVARLLTSEGVLVASTPNRTVAQTERQSWDFHEREYTAGEFVALLDATGFGSIRLFGQRLTRIGELRREVRGEINRLRFNPFARIGFGIQRLLRGFRLEPALPERECDFEIVPLASAADCDRQGSAGPFVILATASPQSL